MSKAKTVTLCPQSGCQIELSKLMELARLLVEMGYTVRRKKSGERIRKRC